MHSTTLNTKRGQAMDRIVYAARVLGERIEMDESFYNNLNPVAKDPQIKELRRLEATAEFIEELARTAGIELYKLELTIPVVEEPVDETQPAEGDQVSGDAVNPVGDQTPASDSTNSTDQLTDPSQELAPDAQQTGTIPPPTVVDETQPAQGDQVSAPAEETSAGSAEQNAA